MSSYDPSDIFKRYAAQNSGLVEPTKPELLEGITEPKKAALDEATQRKIAAIDRHIRRRQAADTLTGKVAGWGMDSDLAKEVTEGAMTGTGSIGGFAGRFIEGGGELVDRAARAILPEEVIRGLDRLNAITAEAGITAPSEWAKAFQNWMNQGAEAIDAGQSYEAQAAQKASTPTGDITDPSSWSLGEDPSLYGYAMHFANILGQFAPQAAGMATRSPQLAAGIIGGAQAGGAAAEEIEQQLLKMSHEELVQTSGMYRDLVAQGVPADEAKQRTAKAGGYAAMSGAALVGGAGGMATAYILGPLQRQLTGNFAARTLGTMGISGVEEAAQEVGEKVVARAGTNLAIGGNLDLTEGTFGDAVLGGGFGAGLGAPATAVDGAQRLIENSAKLRDRLNGSAHFREVEAQARETGDVSPLLNKEQKQTYNPVRAAGILAERAKNEELPEEARTAARQQLQDLVQTLEQDEATQQLWDPEFLASEITDLEQQIASTENAALKADLEEELQLTREQLQAVEAAPEKVREAEARQLRKTRDLLDRVRRQARDLEEALAPQPEAPVKVESLVQEAEAGSTEAGDRVLRMAMTDPDAFEFNQLARLSQATGLSEPQRQFIRQVGTARQAQQILQTMDGVSRDIFAGSPGYRGLPEYQTRIQDALKAGNTAQAQKELRGLGKLLRSHETKAAALQEALDTYQQTGEPLYVNRQTDGTWAVSSSKGPKQSLAVDNRSFNLASRVQQEAQAVRQIYNALEAAIQLAGSQPQVQPQATVQPEPAPQTVSIDPNDQASLDALADQAAAQETEEPEVIPEPAVEPEAVSEPEPTEEPAAAPEVGSITETESAPAEETVNESAAETETAPAEETVTEPTTESEASSEEEADTESEDEAETAETAPESEIQGRLRPFQDQDGKLLERAPTSEELKTLNLLQAYVRQEAGSTRAATLRPLVMVKDFLSQLASLPNTKRRDTLQKYLKKPLTPEQLLNVDHFVYMAQKWLPRIQSLQQTQRDRAYWYKDPVRYLHDDQQQLEENVLTAIAASVYTWIQEEAGQPGLNTHKQINQLLNRDEDHRVTREEEKLLATVGSREFLVIDNLGRRAMQALGFKPTKHAPQDLEVKLRSALGMRALALMLDQGLLERQSVSDPILNEAFGIDPEVRFENIFIRPTRQWHGQRPGKLHPTLQTILEEGKESQQVIQRLLGVEPSQKLPTDEPVPFTQTFAKNSKQRVPSVQRKALKGENQKGNVVRTDMWGLWKDLPQDIRRRIMGATDTANTFLHSSQEISTLARNLALDREDQLFFEFAEQREKNGLLDQPFYLEREVWNIQRVGYKSAINPQTSKVHRHLMAMDGWVTTVQLDDRDGTLTQFWLGVAEGFGEKTDVTFTADMLPKIQAKVAQPEIAAAVDVLVKKLNGEALTEADHQALVQGVESAGENLHSLDALMALAHKQRAEAAGQTSFDTQLMREIDGKTNGPMLMNILLGAADTLQDLIKLANKGGFYIKDGVNQAQSFVQWFRQGGMQDLYETLAEGVYRNLAHRIQGEPELAKPIGAIYWFTGNLVKEEDGNEQVTSDGRNLVKQPLTALMFGSAVGTAVGDMADNFVQDIYDRIAKIINNDNLDSAAKKTELDTLVGHVNTLIDYRNQQIQETNAERQQRGWEPLPLVPPVRPMRNRAEAYAWELLPEQEKAVSAAHRSLLGRAMDSVLSDSFAVTLERRTILNQAAQASFRLYEALYQQARARMIEAEMEAGRLAYREDSQGRKVPLVDLSQAQEQQLRESLKAFEPVIHTPLSQRSKQLDAGLRLAKSERRHNQDAVYEAEVKLSTTLPTQGRDKGTQSLRSGGYTVQDSDPGVGTLVKATHATDSAIATDNYATELPVLNVHDAGGAALKHANQVARQLNEATYRNLRDYNLPGEIVATLERILQARDALRSGANENTRVLESLQALEEQLQATYGKLIGSRDYVVDDPFTWILDTARQAAYQAEKLKLELLTQLGWVDQYPAEGGTYEVSNEDRARALRKLSNLVPPEQSSEVRDLNETLSQAKQTRQMAEYAAKLQAWIGTQRAELAALERQGKNVPEQRKQQLDHVERVARNYLKSGNLLEVVTAEVGEERAPYWIQAFRNRNLEPQPQYLQELPAATQRNLLEQALAENLLDADAAAVAELALDSEGNLLDNLYRLEATQAPIIIQTLARLANSERQTPWGRVGRAIHPSDPTLVAQFERYGKMTGPQLVNLLKRTLGKGPNAAFEQQLLAALARVIPDNLQVKYIRPTTPVTDAELAQSLSKARGLYEALADGNTIYIKSPEFREGVIQPELLLHELVHAAVARIIAQPEGEAKALVQDLETILQAAREYVERNQLDQYRNAVSNVQELVAWGMTNRGFQMEVLGQVTLEERTPESKRFFGARTALQGFIQKLIQLVYRTSRQPSQGQVNGLTRLIGNVSGLFELSSQVRNREASLRLQQVVPDPSEEIRNFSTLEVFDRLPSRQSKGFQQQVRNLLGTLTTALHGPYGAWKLQAQANAPFTLEESFAEAVLTGQLPFTSKVLQSGFHIDEQTQFAVEQLEATARAALNSSTLAYRELSKLYQQARSQLKPQDFYHGDWNQASEQAQQKARRQYEFVFRIQPGETEAEHLARFAAMGLSVEPLNRMLERVKAPLTEGVAEGLGAKLQRLFENLVRLLVGKATHTYEAQPGNEKLQALLHQLVRIEAKRKRALVNQQAQRLDHLEVALKPLAEGVKTVFGKAGEALSNSRAPSVLRATGMAATLVAKDRVGKFMEGLSKLRNQSHRSERLGVMASMLHEARGIQPLTAFAHALKREATVLQQERQRYQQVFKDMVLKGLQNQNVSESQLGALTQVLVRSDLQSLLDKFSLPEIHRLISDAGYRRQQIRQLEQQLKGNYVNLWLHKAKDLGYYLATGNVSGPNLMMNAHNIAFLGNTKFNVSEAEGNAAMKVLEPLISLYALEYTEKDTVKEIQGILDQELARGEANGVEYLLRLHRELVTESQTKLFKEGPVHQAKGYTKDITDPRVDLKLAKGEDAITLQRLGYEAVSPELPQDPLDPSERGYRLFRLADGNGSRAFVSGALSLTGQRHKGSAIHQGITGSLLDGIHMKNLDENIKIFQGIQQQEQARLKQDGKAYDPRKNRNPYLVPVLNNAGEGVTYRYLMNHETKDRLLNRNNRIDDVLGNLAASIYDKAESAELNKKGIDALKAQFDADGDKEPEAYVVVSPQSDDPEIREIYRLLPEGVKYYIKEVWGKNEMRVRAELLELMFGYRKRSLQQAFFKDASDRNWAEKLLVTLVHGLIRIKDTRARLAGRETADLRGAIRVRQIEDAWAELVAEIKDAWVIKNLFTLLGNTLSNASLLMLRGISPRQIIRDHRVAWTAALDYQRDQKELLELQTLVRMGAQSGANMDREQQRILELEQALAANPVREMMEAGMLSSIIEDVDQENDEFTYKSRLSQWVDQKTGWMPDGMKATGKFLYMAHDTPLYRLAHRATQLSDFMARYTLYQHLTQRKNNPLDKATALEQITEEFVNYDIPTHPVLQWLNDHGLVFFTKYYLRMTKVLYRLSREHPGRMLLLVWLELYFDQVPTVLDAGLWNRADNLFSSGAFEYAGAVEGIAPINGLRALF